MEFDIDIMSRLIKRFFSRHPTKSAYLVPQGERIYAVGDIHGRVDLFERVILAIEADDIARGRANTTIILLGDLIDRGPASSSVIDVAIELRARRSVRVLCGNHEEMLLRALGDEKYMRAYLNFGGRETALSYFGEEIEYRRLTFEEIRGCLLDAIPDNHIDFFHNLEDIVVFGDYVFVHAGVRPGVNIEDQSLGDLRWIREPFLRLRTHWGSQKMTVAAMHMADMKVWAHRS